MGVVWIVRTDLSHDPISTLPISRTGNRNTRIRFGGHSRRVSGIPPIGTFDCKGTSHNNATTNQQRPRLRARKMPTNAVMQIVAAGLQLASGRARQAKNSPPHSSRRQRKRLAIGAAEKPVGLRVADDGLRLSVEEQRAAEAIGDVAQMAQPRALVAFLDIGVGPFSVLDAIEEVADVPFRTGRLVRSFDIAGRVPAVVVEDQVALLAVEHYAPILPLNAGLRPDALLPG